MKALAVRQPFAWLIVHGHKTEEFRPWLTHLRDYFFVHANKAIDEKEVEQERSLWAEKDIVLPDNLPTAGIVGVVRLVSCERVDVGRLRRLLGQKSPCGDEHEGPCYSFKLADARPLPFKRYRGQQKFFNVPDDLYGPEFEF